MGLCWELWSITTLNQLDAFASDEEALKLARELLSLDWRAAALPAQNARCTA